MTLLRERRTEGRSISGGVVMMCVYGVLLCVAGGKEISIRGQRGCHSIRLYEDNAGAVLPLSRSTLTCAAPFPYTVN